jgi:hypothetical protein
VYHKNKTHRIGEFCWYEIRLYLFIGDIR